ncbi:type VI secretion system baseplate subunit TssG [Rahnella woolbedingensis]|uniref:Type VI secretion system baseplate subunit TssG n=1 Tax=Rahnella woolbedingensis TaxID=1510574 RepID=A0A419N2V6_9GAMM|nr:type VI secretion system baseplate subunit TssG [Rahnella woolbedingensis]RJT36253.1 type VI secretion system baseplate subunit TssG [Rahnella woolbedingensis]
MDLTRITSRFNFYQQLRTLLRKLRRSETSAAETLNSKLKLISSLSMETTNGQIVSIRQDTPEAPLSVTLSHNGLTGAMGALPTAYSEWMIERHYRYGDHGAKDFLDIFGHRLYCLDYLAWQKNHLYAYAESSRQLPLQQATLAISGLLTSPSMLGGETYAHLFAAPVRSLVNLEVWLSHYYGVPARITPFTGCWKSIDATEICQLGQSKQTLDTAPMIGLTRWEVQSHFDVIFGPVEQVMSHHFIPGGKFYQSIWARIREYVGPGLDFTIHLDISNRSHALVALGTGQLGLNMCIGYNDPTQMHQICLPMCTSYQGR